MAFKERMRIWGERNRAWNERVAVWGTNWFGTMFMTYLFFFYGISAALPFLMPFQPQMLYWSSTVQLWALPLLMVGQRVVADRQQRADNARMTAQEQRALEDHTHIVDIHDAVFRHLASQDDRLVRIEGLVNGLCDEE